MNTKTIAAIAAILIVLGTGYVMARPSGFWNAMMGGYGHGYGMMGQGYGIPGNYGGGMMNGYGGNTWNGMMGYSQGYGRGMMGGPANGYCGGYGAPGYGANATPITIEDAKKAVEQYISNTGNTDLKLSEIIEFDNNFYAGVRENSTGAHAFELLVNKYTGAVGPEMGPNMKWNTKYGHMAQYAPAQVAVTVERATEYAQDYLDKALPGTKTGDVDAFYGYYTIEVTKDGNIYGMLSVNSDTGAVWYHNWHGTFVKVLEVK